MYAPGHFLKQLRNWPVSSGKGLGLLPNEASNKETGTKRALLRLLPSQGGGLCPRLYTWRIKNVPKLITVVDVQLDATELYTSNE